MSKYSEKWMGSDVFSGKVDFDHFFQASSKIELPPFPQPLSSKEILNIGCGKTHFGFRVDKNSAYNPDLVLDLDTESFPERFSSFFPAAVALHFLEHVANLEHVMDEIWRVLQDDAPFYIAVPHFKSDSAFQDFDHKRFFSEETFGYFEGSKEFFHECPKKRWKILYQEVRGNNYKNLLLLAILKKETVNE